MLYAIIFVKMYEYTSSFNAIPKVKGYLTVIAKNLEPFDGENPEKVSHGLSILTTVK